MRLTNRTNRMKVIPLPHETFCAVLGSCACLETSGLKKRIASSLTISAGSTSGELSEAVLNVGHVERMVKRGELALEPKDEIPTKRLRAKQKKRAASTSTTCRPGEETPLPNTEDQSLMNTDGDEP